MFEPRSPGELVEVVGDAHRREAMQMARKLDAIAELLGQRVEEEMALDADMSSVITGFVRTAAEVSAAMNLTRAAARELVCAAETLDCRLPAVAALLAGGQVDWRTVDIIIARTEFVDEDRFAELDARLAEQVDGWCCYSRQRIINAVDFLVQTVDPEAAKKRRVRAFDERFMTVTAGPDGTARVRGSLPARAGAAFNVRLSQLARSVCRDDPRTFTQRRADAVEPALEGRALACECTNPRCPTRVGESDGQVRGEDRAAADAEPAAGTAPPDDQPAPAPPPTRDDQHAPSPPAAPASPPVPRAKPVINVIATAATLAGHSDQPGYLLGYGVIDAEMVRELARDATRRILAEPEISDSQALSYRPTAALDRWIRCRDLTCRFPGCTVPAEYCDIDHTEPFNHADPAAGGKTVPWNMACYCREHHRLKTFHCGPGGWCDQQFADGTIEWTSPTGHVYRTTPGGAELFPELRPKPPRSDKDRERIAKARQRLREQRPHNDYHRHRNRAAADEIYGRQFRNRFRRTRVLFHGYSTADKPSTSPFCRWVNDPLEPEELPPDWQPPPQSNSDPDEPPPF